MKRLATILIAVIVLAGCTFNVYVFPGVKTDVRWPASQPTETP